MGADGWDCSLLYAVYQMQSLSFPVQPQSTELPLCFNLDLGAGASVDGGLLAPFGINFLLCFPSFCIGFLSACVRVLLTSLRRRSSPDVHSQTRASSGAPLVFQCADNVGLPRRLEKDSRREQSSGSGSDCSTSGIGKGSLHPDIFQQTRSSPWSDQYGTLAASVVSSPLGHQMVKLLGTPADSAQQDVSDRFRKRSSLLRQPGFRRGSSRTDAFSKVRWPRLGRGSSSCRFAGVDKITGPQR